MALALLLPVGPAMGCAEVIPPEGVDEPVTTVGCRNSETFAWSILDWQLDVVPDTIESGKSFVASLGGVATFPEDFLDEAQVFFPGGVREVNLVELNGTVHVRSGATGPDVRLTLDEAQFDYRCGQSQTSCDPQNDLEGVPGRRANTDCQPESAANPCGRFLLLPISPDCSPGGICDELGKAGLGTQCDLNRFCITGDLLLPLGAETARYTAESEGDVFFGWAEGESVGATIQEGGPDDGTWILPDPNTASPAGPLGLRFTVAGFPVAIDCTMGVDSRGPLGVGSLNLLSSRTPNSALPSFPIEPPR